MDHETITGETATMHEGISTIKKQVKVKVKVEVEVEVEVEAKQNSMHDN